METLRATKSSSTADHPSSRGEAGAAPNTQDPWRPRKAVWWRGGREAAGRPPGPSPPFPPCSGPFSPCTDFTFSDTVVQSSHVPLPHCFIIIKMLLCISFNHFKIKDELPRTFSLPRQVLCRETSPPPGLPAEESVALHLQRTGSIQHCGVAAPFDSAMQHQAG